MEHKDKLVLGADIGGTKIAAGLVDRHGVIRKQNRTPMVAAGEPAEGLAAVCGAIEASGRPKPLPWLAFL